MASMNDGVSKLWIVRQGRGLDIVGYTSNVEAISHLIRGYLVDNYRDLYNAKQNIREEVEIALKHMDDEPEQCRDPDCAGHGHGE